VDALIYEFSLGKTENIIAGIWGLTCTEDCYLALGIPTLSYNALARTQEK